MKNKGIRRSKAFIAAALSVCLVLGLSSCALDEIKLGGLEKEDPSVRGISIEPSGGVDLSGEMLAAAMDKSRRAGLMIPYIRQDMTRLELPGKQDAVLCTCDGLNYLSGEDCRAFFERAFRYTRSGGAVLFDVSTPRKLAHVLGSNTLTRIEDDYCYIWENSLSRDKKKLTIRLTGFVRNKSGAYDRFEEDQVQHIHTDTELIGMLKEAGFCRIDITGGDMTKPADDRDERWHFIASHP